MTLPRQARVARHSPGYPEQVPADMTAIVFGEGPVAARIVERVLAHGAEARPFDGADSCLARRRGDAGSVA